MNTPVTDASQSAPTAGVSATNSARGHLNAHGHARTTTTAHERGGESGVSEQDVHVDVARAHGRTTAAATETEVDTQDREARYLRVLFECCTHRAG